MVLLLRHTALRISDVATLAKSRIQNSEILLHTLKTGGLVKLPLPPDLQMALDALPRPRGLSKDDPCPYFFWNGIMGREAVVRNVRRTLGAVFRKAKVSHARTHRFRHTLATDILAQGGTIQDVADVLGISPAVAQEHYASGRRLVRIGLVASCGLYSLLIKPRFLVHIRHRAQRSA